MNNFTPTKGNLLQIKKSNELAKLGYDLMDRKRNILIKEMMTYIDLVKSIREEISTTYKKAYIALQESNITLGLLPDIISSIKIDDGLTLSYKSVMGVEIPKLTYTKNDKKHPYGIAGTNTKFDYAYNKFLKVKELTIKLAEIDNSSYRLANAIRKSQKRANALKNIVIPNFESNIKYITEFLEEKEREEFSRMKLIKNNKKR